MKAGIKNGVRVAIILFVATLLVGGGRDLASTSVGYFDLNNGHRKSERLFAGQVYRVEYGETEYSKHLEKLDFPDQAPNWMLTGRSEHGLRKFFHPQKVSAHQNARLRTATHEFLIFIELEVIAPEDVRAETGKLQKLIQARDHAGVRAYMEKLQEQW